MEVRFWAKTDTGRKRDHNEDNFLVDRSLALFVVCDGMGGHAAGEVASEVAARTIRSYLLQRRDQMPPPRAMREESARREVRELLAAAVQEANGRVWTMAGENGEQRGMGTTCSLLLVRGNWGFVGHVGDSRIYRMRRGEVAQMTDDHSLRNRMIRQGKLREDEPFDQNDAITRAVGVAESVEVDTSAFQLGAGDRYVLCSDGLSEYIDDEAQVRELAGAADLRDATAEAIDHANASGGKDNVTVVGVETHDGSGVLDAREATPVGRAVRSLPFFRTLTAEEFGTVLDSVEVCDLGRGESVGSAAQAERSLCVVAGGRLRLTRSGRTVEKLGPGDFFGLRRMFVQMDEQVRARAADEARVAVLARSVLVELMSTDPSLGVKILWGMAAQFGEIVAHLPWEEFRHPDLLAARDVEGAGADSPDGSVSVAPQAGASGEDEGRPPPIPPGDQEAPERPQSSLDETVVNGSVGGASGASSAENGDSDSTVVSGEASTTSAEDDNTPVRRQRHDTEDLKETQQFSATSRSEVGERSESEQGDDATRKTIQINLDEDDPS